MTKKKCAVCGNNMLLDIIDEYYLCSNCDSYNYISKCSDIEDNNNYFNDIFKNDPVKISKIRQKLFTIFNYINKILNFKEYRKYSVIRKNIENQLYNENDKILEIGFGNGVKLISLLKSNKNAYGIDISKKAVENFQNNYPEYKDRVKCCSIKDIEKKDKYKLIYCSALFEHIDNADLFLNSVSDVLKEDSCLIIDSLPVLTTKKSFFTYQEDISFWKPCHRIIYSIKGLEIITKKSGFNLDKIALYDDYNYRILSLYKKTE